MAEDNMTKDSDLKKQNNGSNNKVILMFPGQGSQSIGMGTEFLNENKEYEKYFEMAGEIFGENLSDIINNKDGSGELLDQTRYSQITIYTLSCVLNDYIFNKIGLKKASVKAVAGHSLGDYSALYSCGAFDFRHGAELVSYRGKIMAEFAKKGQMMMAAVIGSDFKTIESVLQNFRQKVFVANYNDYSQIVISGMAQEVLKAGEEIKSRGAKRVLPLKVSIASHCPLMKEVSTKLQKYISGEFKEFPDLGLNFFSSTELSFIDKNGIENALVNQLVNPVRWVNTIETILTDDIAAFIEIGPGKVLSGLVKRIAAKLGREDIAVFSMDSLAEINNLKSYFAEQ